MFPDWSKKLKDPPSPGGGASGPPSPAPEWWSPWKKTTKPELSEIIITPRPAGEDTGKDATGKNSSLLRMFQSPLFDAHLHMFYLHRKNERGVHDYLVNQLFQRSDEDIHFYLPQLCILSLTRFRESGLPRFLLELSARKMHVALKASWLYHATYEDKITGLEESAQKMFNEAEMAAVNSKPGIGGLSLISRPEQDDVSSPDLFQRRRVVQRLRESDAILKAPRLPSGGTTLEPFPFSPAAVETPSSPAPPEKDEAVAVATPPPVTINKELVASPSRGRRQRSRRRSEEPPNALASFCSSAMKTVVRPSGRTHLPSIGRRLGDAWSTADLESENESHGVPREMQKYFIKRRRCHYYTSLSQFVSLVIDVSEVLCSEDRAERTDLMRIWVKSLNEWIFVKRCAVAASEATFSMTGVTLPMMLLGPDPEVSGSSTQIIGVIPDECFVLSSKKRAPYLLSLEIADLDEDIEHLPDLLHLETLEFSRAMENKRLTSSEALIAQAVLESSLYVYGCIAAELEEYALEKNIDLTPYRTTNQTPLQILKALMGIPNHKDRTPSMRSVHEDYEEEPAPAVLQGSISERHQVIHEEECLGTGSSTPPERHSEHHVPLTSVMSSPDLINLPRCIGSDATFDVEIEELKGSTGRRRSTPSAPTGCLSPISDSANNLSHTAATSPRQWPSETAPGIFVSPPQLVLPEHVPDMMDEPSARVRTMKDNRATMSVCQRRMQAQCWRDLLWGELWEEKKERLAKSSRYGKLKSWSVARVFVKHGDDLRQELLASQLIKQFLIIFKEGNIPLWLRPYEILVTGADSGIMEFVPDTQSVHVLKKKYGAASIHEVFEAAFADHPFEAKKNFIESFAAYSIVCYLLQVKDRHNGNIMLDAFGHIIHIDFGYMLSNSPGNWNFETSPFKLTQEYMTIMDNEDSDNFQYFRTLFIRGFLEARKHAERILLMVEMMLSASKMLCFNGAPVASLQAMKERFMCSLTEDQCIVRIEELVATSVLNWRSLQYDNFQRITCGIL